MSKFEWHNNENLFLFRMPIRFSTTFVSIFILTLINHINVTNAGGKK